jgi:putative flippase GtrA
MMLPEEIQVNPFDRLILWFASYFGSKSKEVERFLKFSIVGAVGAIVDFGTLNLLQFSVLVPLDPFKNQKIALASGIAFCAAVLSNFLWNRYWTYPDSRSRSFRRQLALFFVINMLGLGFRLIFVSSTFHLFGEVGATTLENLHVIPSDNHAAMVNQIGTNIAQALSIIIVLFWNFFANRYWTYNDV